MPWRRHRRKGVKATEFQTRVIRRPNKRWKEGDGLWHQQAQKDGVGADEAYGFRTRRRGWIRRSA